MKQVKETKIITYLSYSELSEERQEKEYEKALKEELLYDLFSFDFYNEYERELKEIQEKHNLNITPIYTSGSQHSLLGFENNDNKHDKHEILYKGIYFYFEIDNTLEAKLNFYNEEDYNVENENILKEVSQKVNSFIKDFMTMYKNYEEFFMYGYCNAFEEYVKDYLIYNSEEATFTEEEIIETKVLTND